MRRSRAKRTEDAPVYVEQVGRGNGAVAFQVRDLRQVYRVHQHEAGQRSGDDGKGQQQQQRQCCPPASWALDVPDALGGRKRPAPEDEACPLNEISACCRE